MPLSAPFENVSAEFRAGLATGADVVDDPGAAESASANLQLDSPLGSPASMDPWAMPPFPGWRSPLRSAAWFIRTLFGLASLLLLLALIAAIPLVNFVALGYLLDVEGRVGRTGRFREGFPLLGLAPRLGSIVLGTWLCLIPLRLISVNAAAARIIDPGSIHDERLQTIRVVAAVMIATHLVLALARGGSLGCFLRPIKNLRWLLAQLRSGGYFDRATEHIRIFISALKLQHHFSLGWRGFWAALAWLLMPTLVYASVNQPGGTGALRMLIGGALLTLAFAWVPFLQARLAAENRFRAGFELRRVRQLFRSAPWAWLLAVIVTCVLALPLYLFKAFTPPQDALWPVTLIFIVSMYPVRLITGWAYHRAVRQSEIGYSARWLTYTCVRLAGMLPVLGTYVFVLYFTQFLGAGGRLTLLEHHAFLLPWPYLLGAQ